MDADNNLATIEDAQLENVEAKLIADLNAAKGGSKFLLWLSWALILAIFLVPYHFIAPGVASWNANSNKAGLQTLGVPTGMITTGSGKNSTTAVTGFRPALPGEIDLLTNQIYDSTLGGSRFFFGWGSFMAFLFLQLVILGPVNRGAKEKIKAVEKQITDYKAQVLADTQEKAALQEAENVRLAQEFSPENLWVEQFQNAHGPVDLKNVTFE